MTSITSPQQKVHTQENHLVSSICAITKIQWISSFQREEEETMLYMISSQNPCQGNQNWTFISFCAIEQNNKACKFESELNLILSQNQLIDFIQKGYMCYNMNDEELRFIVSNNPNVRIPPGNEKEEEGMY